MADFFSSFKSLIRITGILVNETPLSIRSGKSEYGGIDNPIIRMNGNPYIPGSSLKGVLRSEAERYVKATFGDKPENVCDIFNTKSERGELKRKEELEDEYIPCIVCRIFGGPTIASRVKFFDSFPKEDKYRVGTSTRVSIYRVTAAQYPGRLFDIEFIEPYCEFDFKLEIENIDLLSGNEDKEVKEVLKFLFIRLIEFGIDVGGMKSVGFGRIKLKKESLNVKKFSIQDGIIKEEDYTTQFLNWLSLK